MGQINNQKFEQFINEKINHYKNLINEDLYNKEKSLLLEEILEEYYNCLSENKPVEKQINYSTPNFWTAEDQFMKDEYCRMIGYIH